MEQQNIDKLRQMRLSGFIAGLEEQAQHSSYSQLSFEERFSFLIEKEYLLRQNNRLKNRLRAAKLKQSVSVEDIEYSAKRNLSKSAVAEFSSCNWLEKKQNLIITGPTGVGKSFIACALGNKACFSGYRVLYLRLSDLLLQLKLAESEGEYVQFISRILKFQLLIVDEWLRDPLSADISRKILDLIDDRYQNSSTIFCSQIPVTDWHQCIQDPTIADAVLDRIVHNSHRIELAGESMRKKKGQASLRSD